MRSLKNVSLNVAGVALGYLVGVIATLIAQWFLFTLIPKIPIIPTILSWPVDYGWYALVGVYSADIFFGTGICATICGLSDWRVNYGVIVLSVINIVRYIAMMIGSFGENGFRFSILIIYLLAILGILYAGGTMSNND